MCTTQLVKLQKRVPELTAEGAAVFAVSIDGPEQARQVAEQFRLTFPVLSDPQMQVIRPYGMRGERMEMADLGYVVIDRHGRIRARRLDREFGDHVELLLHEVRRANAER
jgi:peroxiredoxin Q/BCP